MNKMKKADGDNGKKGKVIHPDTTNRIDQTVI